MPAWLSGSDSELSEQRLSPGGRWQGAAARVLRSCEAPSWHFGEKNTDLEGSPAPAPLCLQSRAHGLPACWGRSSLARRQQQVAMKAVRKCRAGAGGGRTEPETTQQAAGLELRSKPPAAQRGSKSKARVTESRGCILLLAAKKAGGRN